MIFCRFIDFWLVISKFPEDFVIFFYLFIINVFIFILISFIDIHVYLYKNLFIYLLTYDNFFFFKKKGKIFYD